MGQETSVPVYLAAERAKLKGHCGILPPLAFRETKFEQACGGGGAALLSMQLAALGATTPSCVYSGFIPNKWCTTIQMLPASSGRHVTETFTDAELDQLVNMSYNDVPTFDRAGRRYDFQFFYWPFEEHDGYYWFQGVGEEFERFMVENADVAEDAAESGKMMAAQLFAFRSPSLLPRDNGFHDHPDGALGMVLLVSKSDEDDDTAKPDRIRRLHEIFGVKPSEPSDHCACNDS